MNAPYKLGRHPRRPDHHALLTTDGTPQNTFALDATRTEIADTLARGGLVLHADDTVTRAADAAPTRRGVLSGLVLAGAGVSGLASAATQAAPHPDAALLAMIARFDDLERRIWPPERKAGAETLEEERAWDARVEPMEAEQRTLLAEICAARCSSMQVASARARSLMLWSPNIVTHIEEGGLDSIGWDDLMVAALIRDLAGEVRA